VSGPARLCRTCGVKPVIRKTLRYCHDCAPGGPLVPPPCRKCGSNDDYYSAGLCSCCHQYAPQPVTSCLDCHAWGVKRIRGWLCHACIGWREEYPNIGVCKACKNSTYVGRYQCCRLCWRTASDVRESNRGQRPYKRLDIVGANKGGQQLFFADMIRKVRWLSIPAAPVPRYPPRKERIWPGYKQLGLFDEQPFSWERLHGFPEPRRTALGETLDQAVKDRGARHGWSKNTTMRTRTAMRVLLADKTDTVPFICATEVEALLGHGLHVSPTLAVLGEIGILDDDRIPAIETWFETHIEGLPATMTQELRMWFDVLRKGSTTPPRSKPRSEVTIRLRIRWALPTLESWARAGHTSLREISREDVIAALPPSGNPRATLGAALRSIFGVLKAHQVIFINPTARVGIGAIERREPLPADIAVVREALDAVDPVCAVLAALVAFHGLSSAQIRALELIDVRDGRLYLEDRTVLLAQPVSVRIAAYLDERHRRWPRTTNPHLFVNHRTTTSNACVGSRWFTIKVGVAVKVLRDDRILDETHATRGDVRRLCDLFGIGINAAGRYAATLDHPDLAELD